MKQRKGRKKLTIIDCFYFVATTISTVGCALRLSPLPPRSLQRAG